MKIRVVSDLHIDVNKTTDFGFLKEQQDLLIVAGDISGSARKELEFLELLPQNTVCVAGNHLGYDYQRIKQVNAMLGYTNPLEETKEDCLKTLTFDKRYLENSYIHFKNYIIFGGTMYSDFLLYGNKNKDNCINTAERWLNDFRYVYTYEKSKKLVRPVCGKDYIKWFNQFKKKLEKCIEQTDKDIIVVTHFAPSIRSIESKYLNRENRFSSPGSELNAVYANNMEEFIKQNPRIKLWAHGHVHSKFDYNIEQCRVVCCPYGYYGYEQEMLPQEFIGMEIDI